MAGDWIPYQINLPGNPKVWELSDILSEDCRTIVGLLMEFWGWADVHVSSDGILRVTTAQIDREFRVEGFAASLRKVGWLRGRDRELQIPGMVFSDTAKARALESKAKNLRRRGKRAEAETPPQSDDVSDTCPKVVRQLSDTNGAKCPTTGQDRTEQTTPFRPQEDLGHESEIPKPEPVAVLWEICRWYGRQDKTGLSPAEKRAFKKHKIDPEDLAYVRARYTWGDAKPGTASDSDYRKRQPLTLLNAWPTEVDKSRDWCARNNIQIEIEN